MRERTYTTFQVAEVCGVYPSTVINWVSQNQMPAFRTPGGHRRILESDLLAFLQKYRFPIPNWLEVGKRRVLVIEDDAAMGKLLLKALKLASAELDVRLIKDGLEALMAIGQEAPDLVILDVVLPTIDGGHLLKTIKESQATAKTRVIGMTGKRLPADKAEEFDKLTDAFFFKPFDVKALCEKAMTLLRTQTSAPKRVKAK
jgi:excisionase family DNA binding protein